MSGRIAEGEQSLSPLVGKRQYLITYSQANHEIFPTRESFGEAVEQEFNAGNGVVKVDYWAVCKEPHQNGGFHYHCSVKLTGAKKWVGVKTRLSSKYGVQVHFSDKHDFYLSSYRYVCKSDNEVAHSFGHPQGLLSTSSPQTKTCSQASKDANRKRRAERETTSKKKHTKRLSNFNASELVKSEQIKNYTQLKPQKKERVLVKRILRTIFLTVLKKVSMN